MLKLINHHRGKLISIFIFIALLVLAPIILKFYLIAKISDQGIEIVNIDDVDLNILEGTVDIEHLYLNNQRDEKLIVGLVSVDYRWQGIFSGGITAELVEITNADLTVREDEKGIFEIVLPIQSSREGYSEQVKDDNQRLILPNLDVDLIRFNNITVKINTKKYKDTITIKELRLTRASTWHDYPVELYVNGLINDGQFEIDLQALPLAKIQSATGTITLKNYQLEYINTLLAAQNIDVKGDANLTLQLVAKRLSASKLDFQVEGEAQMDNLVASQGDFLLNSQSITSSLDGQVEVDIDLLNYQVTQNLLIHSTDLMNKSTEKALLKIGSINIDALQVDHDTNLAFSTLLLTDLALQAGQQEPLVAAQKIKMETFNLKEQNTQLQFQRLFIEQLKVNLNINEQDQITGLAVLENSFKSTGTEDHTPDSEMPSKENNIEFQQLDKPDMDSSEPMSIKIERINIGKGSSINIDSHHNQKASQVALNIDKFNISNIDTSNIEQDSAFLIKAKLGNYSNVNIEGTSKFLANQLSVEAKGSLDSISLPTLSPYLENIVGYQFKKGQMDHQFTLSLHNNFIDMKNELVLRKIDIKALDDENSMMDLPLPFAIQMLEDDKGVIDLQVPIKGELDNANIGFESLIEKSLTQAMQKGSLNFLKYALQPYGAIVLTTEYVVDQSNNVNFEPLLMQANHSQITESNDYANKLVALLIDREDIDLSICGQSNSDDKQVIMQSISNNVKPKPSIEKELNKQLRGLAYQRGNSLKLYLSEHGISDKRIFLCKAKYKEDGISGVNISM